MNTIIYSTGRKRRAKNLGWLSANKHRKLVSIKVIYENATETTRMLFEYLDGTKFETTALDWPKARLFSMSRRFRQVAVIWLNGTDVYDYSGMFYGRTTVDKVVLYVDKITNGYRWGMPETSGMVYIYDFNAHDNHSRLFVPFAAEPVYRQANEVTKIDIGITIA